MRLKLSERSPPLQELLYGKRHLREQEVSLVLPHGQTAHSRRHAEPKRTNSGLRVVGESSCVGDHRSDRKVIRAGSRLGTIPVDKKKFSDAVSGCRKEITSKAEDVAVPGIEARD